MKLTQYQWAALILGVSVFLGTFGVALAATVAQVTREVPSHLSFATVVVGEGTLGLYHDREATQAVTSLQFEGLDLQPPMRSLVRSENIYLKNESAIELTLIEPCRNVFDQDDESGQRLGHQDVLIRDIETNNVLANMCDRTMVLAPESMFKLEVVLCCQIGLPPGDYSFTTVFGAIGDVPP